MNKRRTVLLILMQVVVWSAFIMLPYFMVPRPNEETSVDAFMRYYTRQQDMAQHVFISSLAFNICLIIFFYIHHVFIFDRFIVPRRFGAYLGIVITSFFAIFFISYLYKGFLIAPDPLHRNALAFREYVRAGTWFLLVLLTSLGIKLLTQWRMAEQRTREIENEQLRTELSFLHAQINPHFLFNSLNTIYSLSLKKSDAAPAAVLKLSELLRYVINESKLDKVPLDEEMNYLKNYIELQKLRSTSSLVVHYKEQGDIHSTLISPLLFLPFVENAFKYGISNNETSPIDISLLRENGSLEFAVRNKKFNGKGTLKPSTGIGINNVRRRLKLLYPEKHELQIDDSSDHYSIKLTIHFV